MKILAAGGGSGGHVTPIVAVLNELVKETTVTDVQFICDKAFAVQAKGIMSHAPVSVSTHVISAGKLRRYKHFKPWNYLLHPSILAHNIVDGGKIGIGLLQSIGLLRKYKPDVIFLKGGYVCLPVGLAARLYRIPVVIHDSDARPGLTNRIIAPWAAKIATGYPLENYPYDKEKCLYTGVPINENFQPVSKEQQEKFKKRLDVDVKAPLIVAVGGGLGARSINQAMVELLPQLAGVGGHAIVVAGKSNYEQVKEAASAHHNVTILEFVSEGLVSLLSAADIVVSRASATFLQELAGLEKPVIIIPSRALDDQHKNAAVYQEADAAIVMTDDEIAQSGALSNQIIELLHDQARRDSLAHNIHQFARPHAAHDVASMIIDVSAKRSK